MNGDPLVSIVLPTYNRAHLLPRAIDSVLVQGYEKWELIVVDDGSTDGTRRVVERFGDDRLRYTRFEENRGIGYGRHEGVSQARGKLIAFIDSDDEWMPGKLTGQIELLTKYPHVDILFSNYRNINLLQGSVEEGFSQTHRAFKRLKLQQLTPISWEILGGLPEALLDQNIIGTASTVMLRGSVFRRIGNFRRALSGPEDFEFLWRAAIEGMRFAYTTNLLIERNKDEQSITAKKTRTAPGYLQALDICEETARRAGRADLIPHLDGARHRVWCSLVREYGKVGERGQAWRAFRRSLRCGVSPSLFLYLGAALLGPLAFSTRRALLNRFSRRGRV